MPTFAAQPDHANDRPTLRLIRIPAGAGITAIVTSDRLIACPVHWWHGRTTPHETENCEACENNRNYSWKSYFAIIIAKTTEHCILEVTARTSQHFEEHQEKYGTLRGCHFQAGRISGRATARCFVRTKPADLTGIELPSPPDVKKILLNIWGFDEDGEPTEKRRNLSRTANVAADVTEIANRLASPNGNGRQPSRNAK